MTTEYANNASTTISALTAGVLSVTVTSDTAFPAVSSPDVFYCTIEDVGGNIEIVKVTNHVAASNVFTIVRGQESTADQTFAAGSIIEMRPTKGIFEELRDHTHAGTYGEIASSNTWAAGNTNTFDGTVDAAGTLDVTGVFNIGSTTVSSDAGDLNTVAGLGGTTLLNIVYPVGCIYISTANTSPQTLFGGTWTAVQTGRVLLSEDGGTTYTAGDTGGSRDAVVVSHTHTDTFSIANESAHTHDEYTSGLDSGTGGNRVSGTATGTGLPALANVDTGAGTAHTHTLNGSVTTAGVSGTDANMPPYLAVYMWERTS